MAEKKGIDRDRVIEAACSIVEKRGISSLGLQAVARALHVKAPSLYSHVAGLDDLRAAVGVRALGELEASLTDAAVGASGERAILAMARAYRDFARAKPGLYASILDLYTLGDGPTREYASAVNSSVIARVVEGYGLGRDETVHFSRAIRSALHGFVTMEMSGSFRSAPNRDASFDRLVSLLVAGLQLQKKN